MSADLRSAEQPHRKRSILNVSLGLLILSSLAAAGGYWAGQRAPHISSTTPTASAAGATKPARTILYYRNPMGLPDTSPTPKKDPMGMDYIPVFADEAQTTTKASTQVSISPEKVQTLGVRTVAVQMLALEQNIRAAGRIEADERRIYSIAPKFEGYIERLHINASGQRVHKGQALFEVYSPELVSAQSEYVIAQQSLRSLNHSTQETRDGLQQLAQASLARLKNWGVSEEQIKRLAASGSSQRTLSLRSPVNGIITEKKAVQGMRFSPGEPLYQVSDLSSLWLMAEVFEQDIAHLQIGSTVQAHFQAYPEQIFSGPISTIYPTLNPASRTLTVRVELPNPQGLLKPGMYGQVDIPVPSQSTVLSIPLSAIIDSGTRQVVLVQVAPGRFEPRPVKLGKRSQSHAEVLSGVQEGEQVVVAANFLIDAESNLQAALASFGAQQNAASKASEASSQASKVGHRTTGKVIDLDAPSATTNIQHAPIASLNWPAMTMEFKLANPALLKTLQPGAMVEFEFVERGPGEWLITHLTHLTPNNPKPHTDHTDHTGGH